MKIQEKNAYMKKELEKSKKEKRRTSYKTGKNEGKRRRIGKVKC